MKTKKFSSVENIIRKAKKGEMYILVDDENRENEGDLVIPASNVSPKKINFMAKYGRGLICLAITDKQAKKLNLSLMSPINNSRNQTAFTVSIEAKKGVTTGISAKDRSKTIKTAIKDKVKKEEIVSPGHIFPIISKDGGVLVRAGHTEASVDISKLANKNPSAVICEIMNDDGVMAKGRELFDFAKKHDFCSFGLRAAGAAPDSAASAPDATFGAFTLRSDGRCTACTFSAHAETAQRPRRPRKHDSTEPCALPKPGAECPICSLIS